MLLNVFSDFRVITFSKLVIKVLCVGTKFVPSYQKGQKNNVNGATRGSLLIRFSARNPGKIF